MLTERLNRFLDVMLPIKALSIGTASATLLVALSNSVAAAERLSLYVGPLQFSIPVDSLEAFASGEEATGDLTLIANRLDPETQDGIRELLKTPVDQSPAVMAQFSYAAMGEDLLQRIGTLIRTQSGSNGFHAIRASLILAAADEAEGLTPINVLRQFPSPDIRIHTPSIRHLIDEIELLSSERAQAVAAIAHQSAQEQAIAPFTPRPGDPDLRQPGRYEVQQREISISVSPRSPDETHASTLITDLYLPQNVSDPVPVVVFSHPLASTRTGFGYLGQHLASHGIAVAIPEHEGSNGDRLDAFMQGFHQNLVDTEEYARRAHEISALLDALEQHPEFSSRINSERVGIMGLSYGATTALGVAGAELNGDRLSTECIPEELTLNLSILLQCRANGLFPDEHSLSDPRIQAVFALFPPASVIFGDEGLAQLDIPTLLVSASEDQLAPSVEEQIRPFQALARNHPSPDRYLVLLDPANHYVIDSVGSEAGAPGFMQGDRPDPAIGRSYIQALSVAFFKTYLADESKRLGDTIDYSHYLSAGYVESIRQDDLSIYFLSTPLSSPEDASGSL
jgi:predicted dienelactone hydrolase